MKITKAGLIIPPTEDNFENTYFGYEQLLQYQWKQTSSITLKWLLIKLPIFLKRIGRYLKCNKFSSIAYMYHEITDSHNFRDPLLVKKFLQF